MQGVGELPLPHPLHLPRNRCSSVKHPSSTESSQPPSVSIATYELGYGRGRRPCGEALRAGHRDDADLHLLSGGPVDAAGVPPAASCRWCRGFGAVPGQEVLIAHCEREVARKGPVDVEVETAGVTHEGEDAVLDSRAADEEDQAGMTGGASAAFDARNCPPAQINLPAEGEMEGASESHAQGDVAAGDREGVGDPQSHHQEIHGCRRSSRAAVLACSHCVNIRYSGAITK